MFSSSKFNSQQDRAEISKGGSSWITRAGNDASYMGWDSTNTTSWNAAGSGGNPLSPEFYQSGFKWGSGATGGTSGNVYFGRGYSVNRYVSMADFSTGGTLDTGRYFGAPSAVNATSDFNYRFEMSDEASYHYGREDGAGRDT